MNFLRQQGLVDISKIRDVKVIVIGAGGIGASTVMALAKVGFRNIMVFDDDIVELHNIPNQMLPITELGEKKVDALHSIVRVMTGIDISVTTTRFDLEKANKFIKNQKALIISAVDNMESRKEIWDWARNNANVYWFIDGRMGRETIIVFSIDFLSPITQTLNYYSNSLFPDEEAEDIPCTERATIYTTNAVSAIIARNAVKMCEGTAVAKHIIFNMKALALLTLTT